MSDGITDGRRESSIEDQLAWLRQQLRWAEEARDWVSVGEWKRQIKQMINYAETKAGDKLKIVGAGAPGFAKLGDIVTVKSCNGTNRCDVTHDETGADAYFALTCGAARLEPVAPATLLTPPDPVSNADGIKE